MKLLNSSRKQRGFSLFDTMLAITVIAIVFIGVGALFLHAKSNSDVQNTIGDIQSVSSAATQLLNQDYSSTITQQNVIDSGLLSDDIVSGATIIGPIGEITLVTSSSTHHQSFGMTVKDLSAAQATTICQQLFASYHVGYASGDYVDAASDCIDSSLDNSTTVYLQYPSSIPAT
jgi:Tfp pilus assembly protein PilV